MNVHIKSYEIIKSTFSFLPIWVQKWKKDMDWYINEVCLGLLLLSQVDDRLKLIISLIPWQFNSLITVS